MDIERTTKTVSITVTLSENEVNLLIAAIVLAVQTVERDSAMNSLYFDDGAYKGHDLRRMGELRSEFDEALKDARA